MTSPTDPSAGAAPSLPDAAPPAPGGDAPFLPAAVRPEPVVSEPAPFDAKAMVESQKRVNENPAYGALPQGTEESREAARKLREQANRKRKRNKMLGWMVALVFLAGIAAAGFLAYQEYQDDQDRRAAERAAAQEADAANDGDEPGALSPLGEQVEVIEAMDDLNDVVRPSAGGFLSAIDDARDVVDDLNDVEGDPATDPAAPAAPTAEGARSLVYTYRTWETADPTSPSVEYLISYDVVGDTYIGEFQAGDGSGGTVIGTDPVYRNAITPDLTFERVPRSAASLDPAPDFPIAKAMTADDVVPPSAQPFRTPGEVEVGLGATTYAYTIDVNAWQRADPAAYRAWLDVWNDAGPTSDALIDPAGRQVASDRPSDVPLHDWAPGEVPFPGDVPAGSAAVLFTIDGAGRVLVAAVVDTKADFRSSYVLVEAHDEASMFGLDDRNWG